MERRKVCNFDEFRKWVRMQLVEREISQSELARQMQIPKARISEATHGKPSGNKFIIPIIEKLNGNISDFEEFLKNI